MEKKNSPLGPHSTLKTAWCFRAIAGVTLFSLLSSFSAFAQVPSHLDLQAILKAPEYPLIEAPVESKSLQARFQKISRETEILCQREESVQSHPLACLWPQIARELDLTMTALAADSPDSRHVALTLAARLHPADFFSPSLLGKTEIPFDALFARFLMAQRLIRDVWPSVEDLLRRNESLRDPQDRLVEAWLTTSTPWSFSLRAMRNFSCMSATSSDCRLKRQWGEVLEKSLSLVDEDEILKSQVSIAPEDFVLSLLRGDDRSRWQGSENQEADRLMHELLRGVLEGLSADYLFFSPGSLEHRSMARQVHSYLAEVEKDSLITFDSLHSGTGRFCEDFLRLSRNAPDATKGVPCPSERSRETVAASLEARSSLYRVAFLQTRSTLAFVSRANRGLSREFISARQRERAFRDILETRKTIRTLKLPSQKLLHPDEARRAARFLVIYLYDMVDGTEFP